MAILIGCLGVVNSAFARVDRTNRYICNRWESSQGAGDLGDLLKGGVR